MDAAVVDGAIAQLLPKLPRPRRLKLFGGEPLLRPDLVARAIDAARRVDRDAVVELSTRERGLGALTGKVRGAAGVEIFAGSPRFEARLFPRAVLNVLLAPGEGAVETAARVLRARAAGFSRWNLLPAYLTRWRRDERDALRRRFSGVRLVLEKLARRGDFVEVVNLKRTSSVPLFNDGWVVDADGAVYSSNLALTVAARAHKRRLYLGRVGGGLETASPDGAREVLRRSFPEDLLADTFAVDGILGGFCRELREAGLGEAAADRQARPC